MKSIKTVSLILAATLLFSLCGCSARSNNSSGPIDTAKYNIGDATITDKIERIDLDWTSGTITFDTHNSNTIDIAEKISGSADDKERMHWRIEGTTLYIKYDDSSVKLISIGKNLKKDLTVTLPENLILSELDVDATSAKITGPDLKASDLDIDLTSGDLDISCAADKFSIDATSGTITAKCSAKTIDIDAVSGKVNLTQTGSSDDISINVTSGDIHMDAEAFKNLTISGTSSDVDLYLPSGIGFTADVDTTSGKFETDFPVKMQNDTYTAGDGAAKINIDLTSGNAKILENK